MKTVRLMVSLHGREPRQARQSVPGVRNCAGHRGRTVCGRRGKDARPAGVQDGSLFHSLRRPFFREKNYRFRPACSRPGEA